MAPVRINDNNTKGFKGFKSSVFDSYNYEGENYADTRNTYKRVNKVDPQKTKWYLKHYDFLHMENYRQAMDNYWKSDPTVEDEEEQSKYGRDKCAVKLTENFKKINTSVYMPFVVFSEKKEVAKGAKKRGSQYQQFLMDV
jgi:hypothetical protein